MRRDGEQCILNCVWCHGMQKGQPIRTFKLYGKIIRLQIHHNTSMKCACVGEWSGGIGSAGGNGLGKNSVPTCCREPLWVWVPHFLAVAAGLWSPGWTHSPLSRYSRRSCPQPPPEDLNQLFLIRLAEMLAFYSPRRKFTKLSSSVTKPKLGIYFWLRLL